jgi:hypothetical protein
MYVQKNKNKNVYLSDFLDPYVDTAVEQSRIYNISTLQESLKYLINVFVNIFYSINFNPDYPTGRLNAQIILLNLPSN